MLREVLAEAIGGFVSKEPGQDPILAQPAAEAANREVVEDGNVLPLFRARESQGGTP